MPSKTARWSKLIVEELARLDAWARQNFKDVAGQLSSQIGLDVNIVQVAAERGTYDVRLLDAKVIAEQQRIADVFHQLKLIPKPLSVKDICLVGAVSAAHKTLLALLYGLAALFDCLRSCARSGPLR